MYLPIHPLCTRTSIILIMFSIIFGSSFKSPFNFHFSSSISPFDFPSLIATNHLLFSFLIFCLNFELHLLFHFQLFFLFDIGNESENGRYLNTCNMKSFVLFIFPFHSVIYSSCFPLRFISPFYILLLPPSVAPFTYVNLMQEVNFYFHFVPAYDGNVLSFTYFSSFRSFCRNDTISEVLDFFKQEMGFMGNIQIPFFDPGDYFERKNLNRFYHIVQTLILFTNLIFYT
ncbi:hypothetical protein CRYUN_Cryun09bG0169300 [Craigia yunnanensis]